MDKLYQYAKGTPQQYEDIIDFADLVFSIKFRSSLPKLYGNRPEMAVHHHVVTEGHRIKGLVGSFPITLMAGETPVKVRGIGTVSVHSQSRGTGYMKICMNEAIKEAQNEGADLMVLSGIRQRYENFGFALCGTGYQLSLSHENLRYFKHVNRDSFSILPLRENPGYVKDCKALFDQQLYSAVRVEEDFLDVVSSWTGTPYVILENGEFFGYFSMNGEDEKRVQELILSDESKADAVALKMVETLQKDLRFVILFSQLTIMEKLHAICGGMQTSVGPMFRVLNFKTVIGAYLSLKHRLQGICDGSYVIEVTDMGKYEICVKNGVVTVTDSDKPGNQTLSAIEMSNFLFSPMGQISPKPKTDLEKSWFPIPLAIAYCDNV